MDNVEFLKNLARKDKIEITDAIRLEQIALQLEECKRENNSLRGLLDHCMDVYLPGWLHAAITRALT